MKVFVDHVVTTMEDLTGGMKEIPSKEALPIACQEHGEIKKLF